MRPTLGSAGLLLACATFVGLYFASQVYFNPALQSKPSVSTALTINLTYYYLWALVAPIVFLLGRRIPVDRRGWGRSLFAHLVASVILTSVIILAAELLLHLFLVRKGSPAMWVRFAFGVNFHALLPTYWMLLLASLAFDFYVKLRDREVRAAQLEGRLSEARLTALKAQLQPHFLFNTLNSISSLMYEDVAAADAMLTRLSELLRITIDSDRQIVTLKEELDLVRRYLAIEHVRFEDRLVVDFQIESGTEDLLVPSLVLQPLVENAIRHSIAPREHGGRIRISARRAAGGLQLAVEDDGPGVPAGSEPQKGIGLANTEARLAQLYGMRSAIQLTNSADGGFAVRIVIPVEGQTA